MWEFEFTKDELKDFYDKAASATYAGGGAQVEAERAGFNELEFSEGDFYYRDSYTGFSRSRGMEVIRYKGKPVFCSLYGGGMTDGNENLAGDCFEFLKKALGSKESETNFRGPDTMEEGEWSYKYVQSGDVEEFSGKEEISFQDKLVFYHNAIGGTVEQ